MSKFRQFLRWAEKIAEFHSITVEHAMNFMEPLPFNWSWKIFLDSFNDDGVHFDVQYEKEIKELFSLLLSILEEDSYLSLDGDFYDEPLRGYHVSGRFIYTSDMERRAKFVMSKYYDPFVTPLQDGDEVTAESF